MTIRWNRLVETIPTNGSQQMILLKLKEISHKMLTVGIFICSSGRTWKASVKTRIPWSKTLSRNVDVENISQALLLWEIYLAIWLFGEPGQMKILTIKTKLPWYWLLPIFITGLECFPKQNIVFPNRIYILELMICVSFGDALWSTNQGSSWEGLSYPI